MAKYDVKYMVDQLVKAREGMKMTAYEAATKMGITVSAYYYLEQGRVKNPYEVIKDGDENGNQ